MEKCKNCGRPFIPYGGKCVYCGTELTAKSTVKQHTRFLIDYSLDIVFCIDCTCSMAPVLDSIKENIIKFIDVCNDSKVDWRGRIVLFRDSEVDKEWLENDNPFVSQKENLEAQLDSVMAKGSIEDETNASSILDALFYAQTASPWRKIRFPGGPLDSDRKEFLKSGGGYGFRFIVGFTDSVPKPYSSKTLELIQEIERRKAKSKQLIVRMPDFYGLFFAPKGKNYDTGLPPYARGWDYLNGIRHTLKDFEDPIEFYYHKELDFSSIYSVLSRTYS